MLSGKRIHTRPRMRSILGSTPGIYKRINTVIHGPLFSRLQLYLCIKGHRAERSKKTGRQRNTKYYVRQHKGPPRARTHGRLINIGIWVLGPAPRTQGGSQMKAFIVLRVVQRDIERELKVQIPNPSTKCNQGNQKLGHPDYSILRSEPETKDFVHKTINLISLEDRFAIPTSEN